MKTIVADTSSLILLHRVSLIPLLSRVYCLAIPRQVYAELDQREKNGAGELCRLLRTFIAEVTDGVQAPQGLCGGEAHAISLFVSGVGNFLLLDDKKAIAYCRKRFLPFVNGLLIPQLLWQAGRLTREEMEAKRTSIWQQGYYSQDIYTRACRMREDELREFLPSLGNRQKRFRSSSFPDKSCESG